MYRKAADLRSAAFLWLHLAILPFFAIVQHIIVVM